MNKTLLAVLASVLFLPYVQAAPDTPPSMTWELTLPEPVSSNECDFDVSEVTRIVDVRTAPDGSLYTLELCNRTAEDGIVLRHIFSTGIIHWSQYIEAATGSNLSPMGMDVDPASRAWVWYNDPIQVTTDRVLVVYTTDQEVALTKSNTDFASSETICETDFEEINATSFKAYGGCDSARIGLTCTESDECSIDFDTAGQPGAQVVHHAQPYADTLYAGDANNGAGNGVVMIFNQTSGSTTTTGTFAGFPACCGLTRVWYNPINGRLTQPYYRTGAGRNAVAEWNATSLAQIRDVSTPIESVTGGYAENLPRDSYVDANGDIFYCGRAFSSGSAWDSYFAKYNSTANVGMRWNVTYSKVATDSNVDDIQSCDLGTDGSIYVGTLACSNADSRCTSYLRKYSGAGLARAQSTLFTGFTEDGGAVGPGGNLLQNIIEFVSDGWGFDATFLFGLLFFGIIVWGVKDHSPLIVAIVSVIAILVCVAFDLFPDWLIFVVVFIIIAVAGHRLFNRDNGDD